MEESELIPHYFERLQRQRRMTYLPKVVSGQWPVVSWRRSEGHESAVRGSSEMAVVRYGGLAYREAFDNGPLPLTTDHLPAAARRASIGELSVSHAATGREELLRRSATSLAAAESVLSPFQPSDRQRRRMPLFAIAAPRAIESAASVSIAVKIERHCRGIAPGKSNPHPVPVAAASSRVSQRFFRRICRATAKPCRRRDVIRL